MPHLVAKFNAFRVDEDIKNCLTLNHFEKISNTKLL